MEIDRTSLIKISENEIEKNAMALRSLRVLATGLSHLYECVRGVETQFLKRLIERDGTGTRHVIYGGSSAFDGVPIDLIECAFRWYAVSVCDFVRVVTSLATFDDENRKQYTREVLGPVQAFRDKVGAHPGLLWIFTGTPDFFDTRQGVAGLPPLHDRIKFDRRGEYASVRQAQLELAPFNQERLRNVAFRLRDIFPAEDVDRLRQRITDEFINRLVQEVTTGFKGDVGVVPRQFLREFVTQMDLVDGACTLDKAIIAVRATIRQSPQHD